MADFKLLVIIDKKFVANNIQNILSKSFNKPLIYGINPEIT